MNTLEGIKARVLGRIVELFSFPVIVMGVDPSGRPSAVGVTAAVSASQTLTFDANPTAGDTFTIGSIVYTTKSTMTAAYDVKIGASAAATLDNIKAAVNGTGTPGTEYFAGTLTNPIATATTNTDTTQLFVATNPGAAGNAIPATETFTSAGNVFGAAVFAGGANSAFLTSAV